MHQDLTSGALRVAALVALVGGGLALGGCTLASEPVPAGPIQTGPLPGEAVVSDLPVSLPRASEGALIYLERCASCHGARGEGGGEFAAQLAEQGADLPDLSDVELARSRSAQDWYRIITDGTVQAGGLMPPWGEALTDSERWDVTAYLFTLSSSDDLLAQGEALYLANCAECHGESGELEGLDNFANLAALSQRDLYEAYVAGGADAVHTFDALTEKEGLALALYAQTFGYDATLMASSAGAAPVEEEEEAAPVEEVPAEEEAAVEEEAPAEEAAVEGAAAGTVTGRVTNATGGAGVPAEIEVQLHGLQLGPSGDIVEFMAATAVTDEEGSFRFEDLPFDLENSAYVVNVIYDGVEFANGAAIDPQDPALDLPVTIFEATTDPDVIAVDAMHVIVREHPDALLVMQFYVFSNASDRVFVTEQPVSGGRRGSVAVQLPPDARNVLFEEGQLGGRFIEMGDRIVDTDVMLPGSQSQAIFVTYFLDFDGSQEITLPLIYQTRSVNVLVEEGAQVRSEQLSPAGSQVFDGQAYDQYVGQDFAAGDSVTFRLRSGGPGRRSIALGIGVALAVLVTGGAVYWLVRGRGAGEYLPVAGLSSAGEALVRQMAELDETFQAGRINRFEYEAERAELKAKLAESLEEGA